MDDDDSDNAAQDFAAALLRAQTRHSSHDENEDEDEDEIQADHSPQDPVGVILEHPYINGEYYSKSQVSYYDSNMFF